MLLAFTVTLCGRHGVVEDGDVQLDVHLGVGVLHVNCHAYLCYDEYWERGDELSQALMNIISLRSLKMFLIILQLSIYLYV